MRNPWLIEWQATCCGASLTWRCTRTSLRARHKKLQAPVQPWLSVMLLWLMASFVKAVFLLTLQQVALQPSIRTARLLPRKWPLVIGHASNNMFKCWSSAFESWLSYMHKLGQIAHLPSALGSWAQAIPLQGSPAHQLGRNCCLFSARFTAHRWGNAQFSLETDVTMFKL